MKRPVGIAVAVAAAALVAAAVLVATGDFLRRRQPYFADASDPRLVARGAIVYRESCAQCHGARLEGQPDWRQPKADGTLPAPPHDATGHTWHHSDQMLFQVTKYGSVSVAGPGFRSGMPIYANVLSDADIWAALAYIKSRWPPDVQAAQRARSGGARR